jgi:hypothetical protein
MSKTLKGVLVALAILFVAGIAFLVGRGQTGGTITDTIQFSINVSPSGAFTLAVDPPEANIKKGDPLSFAITAIPTDGFDAGVGLTLAGLPEGSWMLGSDILTGPGYTTTLTVDTTKLVSNTGYSCSLTGVDR